MEEEKTLQKKSCEQLQKEVEELRKCKEEWNNAKVAKETLRVSNTSSDQTCSASTAANLLYGIKKGGESNEKPVEGENSVAPAK